MATCPECDAEIEVDEFDVDKGDLISCPDCGLQSRSDQHRPRRARVGRGRRRRRRRRRRGGRRGRGLRRRGRCRRRRRYDRGGLGLVPHAPLAGETIAGADAASLARKEAALDAALRELALADCRLQRRGGQRLPRLRGAPGARRPRARASPPTARAIPNATARSRSVSPREFGFNHLVIQTAEMARPEYRANPANRCYYCKHELYTHLVDDRARARHPGHRRRQQRRRSRRLPPRAGRRRASSACAARSTRPASRRTRSASSRGAPGCRPGTSRRRRACRRASRTSAKSPTRSCG